MAPVLKTVAGKPAVGPNPTPSAKQLNMKIYFAGSIRGGQQDQSIYAQIIAVLARHGEVLTEHIGNAVGTSADERRTDSTIYERDMAWLNEADVIVAEVTNPSLGVGYEIGSADGRKPILCLYRPQEGKRLSAMISGSKSVRVVEYRDIATVEMALEAFFRGLV